MTKKEKPSIQLLPNRKGNDKEGKAIYSVAFKQKGMNEMIKKDMPSIHDHPYTLDQEVLTLYYK